MLKYVTIKQNLHSEKYLNLYNMVTLTLNVQCLG